jgi:predicted nucleotidyltransferase
MPLNQFKSMLITFFTQQSKINFALLFGSQINGTNHTQSDWDFAIWFNNTLIEQHLIQKEQLRQQLSQLLQTSKIDIVDLQTASLSLKSSIVENHIILKGEYSLELLLFYKRVWALEADFYWRLQHENRALSG